MTGTDRRVVVIAGAGAGAGRAIAERFGREGWQVALLSRDADRVGAAAAAIRASGGEALALPSDVRRHPFDGGARWPSRPSRPRA